MKTKRPTPKKLPSGTWRCQVRVDGKRVSVTDEDKKVCQAKAIAMQAKLIEKEERHKPISLEEAVKAYIDSKSNTLSPATIRGYDTLRRNRFQSLMKQNVYSITKRDVQKAVNDECKKKISGNERKSDDKRYVSPKTIYNAYGLIRPVLKEYGVDVSGVTLPKNAKPKKKYLRLNEVGKLLDAAKGDSCEIEILLAIWLGLRRSEIIGLCWDCVHEKENLIEVRRAMVPDVHHKFVLKDYPKNDSSIRTIKCPQYIMEKLSEVRSGRTEGLCFHIHPDTLRKHIHALCAKNGLTDTATHGLRHTSAAVSRNLGISDAHAMERHGWTEEVTYKRNYSYAFDDVASDEDELLDQFYLLEMQKQAGKQK